MSKKLYDFFEKDKTEFRYDRRSIFMDARNILIASLVIAIGTISYQASDFKMSAVFVFGIGIIALLAGLISVAIGIKLTLKNKA